MRWSLRRAWGGGGGAVWVVRSLWQCSCVYPEGQCWICRTVGVDGVCLWHRVLVYSVAVCHSVFCGGFVSAFVFAFMSCGVVSECHVQTGNASDQGTIHDPLLLTRSPTCLDFTSFGLREGPQKGMTRRFTSSVQRLTNSLGKASGTSGGCISVVFEFWQHKVMHHFGLGTAPSGSVGAEAKGGLFVCVVREVHSQQVDRGGMCGRPPADVRHAVHCTSSHGYPRRPPPLRWSTAHSLSPAL